MGIRPSMYLIIGIADAIEKDPRFSYPNDVDIYSDLPVELLWHDGDEPYDEQMREWGTPEFQFRALDDVLYNWSGWGEFSCRGVVGLKLDRQYDTDIYRALAAIDEKYMQDGYQLIPEDDSMSEWALERYGFNEEDRKCHRIVPTVLESMPSLSRLNWKRTVHYMRLAGWNVGEEDLRYILVWHWS